MPDIVVYCETDGFHHIGVVDGDWFRWEARAGGWIDRKPLKTEPDVSGLVELEPRLASIALRLGGWEGRTS